MMDLWAKFLKLFDPPKGVPAPSNRKDRRTRLSVARRNRSLKIVAEDKRKPLDGTDK